MQAALRPPFSQTPASSAAEPFFPPQLLARLDKNGPRYTSYPTADRYHGGFGVADYQQALRQRRQASPTEPLSLYVHIPFCDSVCYYCACNKVVTRHHDRAARYLDALAREIELHVDALGPGVPVSQLHFGGGTPTFLSDAELTRLMDDLRRAFRFAPHSDSLAQAKQRGELHRNFQGYSTQPDRDLVALGVSAIGRIGNTYSQNVKTLDAYYEAIESGRYAVERGMELSADDLVRREIIMDIMCQGDVDFSRVEARHGLRFGDYFGRELYQLANLAELGLVNLRAGGVQVTGLGWYFVRAVAMTFDGYLRAASSGASYSRII